MHPGASVFRPQRAAHADLVVGVSDGSTLDTAKAVAGLLSGEQSVRAAIAARRRDFDAVPLIAVPTTAGTGSEVTSTATVWDDRAKYKHALSGPRLYPCASIVDPALTMTVPRPMIAGTGLDALAHTMESAWSVNATETSIGHACGLLLGALARYNAAVADDNCQDVRGGRPCALGHAQNLRRPWRRRRRCGGAMHQRHNQGDRARLFLPISRGSILI